MYDSCKSKQPYFPVLITQPSHPLLPSSSFKRLLRSEFPIWGSHRPCQPRWAVFFRSPALPFSYSRRLHLTSLCFSMVAYSFCERSLDTLGMPGFFLLPLLRLLLFLLVFLLFFFLAFLLSPFVTCRIAERRQENVNVLLGSDWNNTNGKKDSFL